MESNMVLGFTIHQKVKLKRENGKKEKELNGFQQQQEMINDLLNLHNKIKF